MLDERSGLALSKDDARSYARNHDLVFIEGSEVVEYWEKNPAP
jgi:3,4-dihydroxy 2-butanone 4-phosphate synthase